MNRETELTAFRSISNDIISHILTHLPHKSLCRFMCVSKFFNSTISNMCFLTSTYTTSSTNFNDTELTVSSAVHYHPRIHLNCFRFFYQQPDRSIILPVLDIKTPRWNHLYTFSFFGYDRVNKQRKVLRLSFLKSGYNIRLRSHVLLINRRSWKRICETPLHYPVSDHCVCIDGVLYYKAEICYKDSKIEVLVAFNVELETFRFIHMPDDLRCVWNWNPCLMQFDGRLVLIDSFKYLNSLNMWMLKDSPNSEWIHRNIVVYESNRI